MRGRSNKEYVGERYNDWEVIDWIQREREVKWICRCKCGNIKEQKVDNIKSGRSKMCKACSGRKRRKGDKDGRA